MNVAKPGVRDPLPGVVYPHEADLRRYVDAGALTSETLIGAYRDAFRRHASRVALDSADGPLSYRELDERSDRLACALIDLGVKPLERALFQMANSRDLVVAVFACLKAGVIPVCTLAGHREHEIGALGRNSEAALYFVQGDDAKFDFPGFAKKMAGGIPSLRHIIVARGKPAPGTLSQDALIEGTDAARARSAVDARVAGLDPFQVALFQLSGGTTGVSKIIPRFSNEYLYNMRAVWEHTRRGVPGRRPGDTPEVVYSAGPYLHNAGFVVHWGPCLLHGGMLAIGTDFSEDGLLADFEKYRPTWTFLAKPLLLRLAAARRRKGADLSFIESVVTAGSAAITREQLGVPGYHCFGMAEGCVIISRVGHPTEVLDNTVGQPVSALDEIRIVRPGTEIPVGEGEIGEFIVKGPYTLNGYYNAAAGNRDSFTSDGLFRSGDLMRCHRIGGEAYYSFEGRVKDIVKRGGESISCEEVERALRSYPGLADVAIVAMPDEMFVEKACAFVIMRPGVAAPGVASFGAHLEREGLAKFKWPERVEPVSVFPMTNSGKLSKPLLRQMIAEKIKAESARAEPAASTPSVLTVKEEESS